jgi:hypothetical protein
MGTNTRPHNGSAVVTELLMSAKQAARLPPLNGSVTSWCGVLEDEERVSDRGYFVMRHAVPKDELRAMQQFVPRLGSPLRHLCGASNIQPDGCRMSEFRDAYPRTHALMDSVFHRWRVSGFHAASGVGWPLEMLGGEFLSTGSWQFAHKFAPRQPRSPPRARRT